MEQPCNHPPVYLYGEADRRNLLQQCTFRCIYFVTEVHPELNFSVSRYTVATFYWVHTLIRVVV